MLNKGYVKPFKTYEEQLCILSERGLAINDEPFAQSVLRRVGYYRLSAYSLTLRKKDDHFYGGVTFENIYELYRFDDAFRRVVLKYSCYIEILFRSYISYFHAGKYQPLGYLDSSNFADISRHSNFLSELSKEVNRSDDVFIEHHKTNHGSVYPFWVIIEVTSYGVLSKLYKNLLVDDRNEIAKRYVHYGRKYVENWLQCCTYCRNVAAHGGRFYNRHLKSCPVKLSKNDSALVSNTSPFAFVIAIHHLLPDDATKQRFIDELEGIYVSHPFALLRHMGFPEDWKDILAR